MNIYLIVKGNIFEHLVLYVLLVNDIVVIIHENK